MHIGKVASIAQLGLKQIVKPVEFFFNGEIWSDSRHLAKRLDIDGLERAPVRFRGDIRKQVRVVIEARTGYNGDVPPVALQNNAEYPIDVSW